MPESLVRYVAPGSTGDGVTTDDPIGSPQAAYDTLTVAAESFLGTATGNFSVGEIVLLPGVYAGVVLDPSRHVTIRGIHRSSPKSSLPTTPYMTVDSGNVVDIAVSGTVGNGFVFYDFNIQPAEGEYGIYAPNVSHLQVRRVGFRGSGGVAVAGHATGDCSWWRIRDNYVRGLGLVEIGQPDLRTNHNQHVIEGNEAFGIGYDDPAITLHHVHRSYIAANNLEGYPVGIRAGTDSWQNIFIGNGGEDVDLVIDVDGVANTIVEEGISNPGDRKLARLRGGANLLVTSSLTTLADLYGPDAIDAGAKNYVADNALWKELRNG